MRVLILIHVCSVELEKYLEFEWMFCFGFLSTSAAEAELYILRVLFL